ncbi:MAG: HEAT repeat domain-containing protein [Treponema sp.]|nr:HEAT repeat domain-containing protein [Treponema sp.]
MINFINSLLGFDVPVWAYIAAAGLLLLIALFLNWLIHTRIFMFRLRRIINAKNDAETAEAKNIFEKHYPANKLSRSDLKRILLYCPRFYLFKAFIAAGRYPQLQKVFNNWMLNEGKEKVIRLLAETCRGEEFDSAYGKCLLENNDDAGTLLRELTGEPEWFARYFAYKILLLDRETLTERSMEDGINDPHPLIRKILTENISFDSEKTWVILWDKLIHDPVYEVRETARKRITKEYMDRYCPKDAALNEEETVRVLELLDPDCQEDRTFAMLSLESGDKAFCYPSAVFLEKCGVLASLIAKITLDDITSLEHTTSLLKKALDVNVSGFLKDYPTGDGAPLLSAARLLAATGTTYEHICYLEKKVFAFFGGKKPDPSTAEIYTKTLEAVIANGNNKAFEILTEELYRRETDPVYLNLILPQISNKTETIFAPILFRYLENAAFPAREELVKLLGTFSPDVILPKVFNILNGSRADNPHIVRISALKILGRMHLPFCLMRILESLPTLTTEETDEFARLIADYPQEMFEEKTRILLATPDARIRASLFTILPITKNDSFMKEIRSSLKDVDPDVRIAAIKALLGFGEIKLLNQETSMLHDPVERVRLAAAEVIAKHGNASAMEILKTITANPNETDVVRLSVIAGLGQASGAEGISILVSVLDSFEDFRIHAEKALAMRTTRRDITQLIEIFKDAEPHLREKLIPVFKAQGKKAEPQILEILKDDVSSFKPYLVKILEETGYIDETKRRLSKRNVEIRREAAMLLSLLDTLPAFRGLVLAAKDPDQEVRVCVVKALEKLKNDKGTSPSRDILEKLKDDPDSRIRKYTYWALERLDSLSME